MKASWQALIARFAPHLASGPTCALNPVKNNFYCLTILLSSTAYWTPARNLRWWRWLLPCSNPLSKRNALCVCRGGSSQ